MVEYGWSIEVPKVAKVYVELIRAEIIREKSFEKLEGYFKSDLCPLCNHKLKNTTPTLLFFLGLCLIADF